MKLSLGCIADDYTGASDLANTLTRQGLRTVQTIGVPSDDLALPEVDAVVVSLKSRSIEADLAVTRSRAAEKWLRGRGAGHVLFKICSTFDSTDAGNIGPVMDALRADSGDAIVLVTPAFPETGRTVYQGNLVRRRRAAERKPAEGSSAQPDARFQSGAGPGAAEPYQGRAGRSGDAVARRGCRSRPPRRSRRQRFWRRHHRRRVRPRSRNHRQRRAGPSPVGRRFRHRARSRPGAGRLRQGQDRLQPGRLPARRSADRRRASPGVVRRQPCSRSRTPRRRWPCCIWIPNRSSRGLPRRGGRWPGPAIESAAARS